MIIKEGLAINYLGNKEKIDEILFINVYGVENGNVVINFRITGEKPSMVYSAELKFGKVWFKNNPRLRLL